MSALSIEHAYRVGRAPRPAPVMYATPARLRAPIANLAALVIDERPLLAARLESFRARVDSWQLDGVLATIDEVPLSVSAVAWSPNRFYDQRAYTYGVARALVPLPEEVRLRMTPRRVFDLRTWGAALGLSRQPGLDGELTERFAISGNLDGDLARAAFGPDAASALCSIRSILIELSITKGILSVAWQAPGLDEHAVLPSAVVVALRDMARALARE
ncbi:MAG: hypothetical protein JWP97_634 [Labilithrix sp.]|nr:hypothetical protein [Labilithrix sp.]